MGKFIKALKKIGKTTGRVLTSDSAKKIYSTLGNAALRFVESDVGNATIDGLIQGTAQSIINGENLGESIKQSVVLNVLHSLDSPPDPLSPGEQGVYDKLKDLDRISKEQMLFEKYQNEIQQQLGEEVIKLRKYALGEERMIEELGGEVKAVDYALDGLIKIDKLQEGQMQRLYTALSKERIQRTQDEVAMVKDYNDKIEALQSAISVERDALQEEAVQEIVEMATNVVETASEEVPVFGAATANVIATGRAIEGTLKLKNVIEKLSGIDLSHTIRTRVEPRTLDAVLDYPDSAVPEKRLAEGVYSKLTTIREHLQEHEHVKKTMVPKLEQWYKDNNNKWHPKVINQSKIPRESQPQIHVYCAPWDSDYIFMLRVNSPHHMECGFFFGIDLQQEFVYYEDLNQEAHHLNRGAIEVAGRSFRQAYREFLAASANREAPGKHHDRLLRSANGSPIYLASLHYSGSYEEVKMNALRVVHDEKLQLHLLRGPLHYQRRIIMAAIMHGVKILEEPFDTRFLLQGL
ncbi:VP5 [Lebombo virus]|uniref:Outer capsid protein VP5 n=1 Tax=Lebombo virus TaxID=40057 RepID=W5QLZ9_9REOV|nr:VP5 [Lebombo virus]AFX73381.1 VP5 [Lebombo virus]